MKFNTEVLHAEQLHAKLTGSTSQQPWLTSAPFTRAARMCWRILILQYI